MKFMQYIDVWLKKFTNLIDTPSSYTGMGGKIVKVKADESGLEFAVGGGASPPATVSSITSNDDNGTNHTHALNNTGVTAGSYTLASITVDNKGRITAANNGTSPAVNLISHFLASSPRSDIVLGLPTSWTNLGFKAIVTMIDKSTGEHDDVVVMLSRNSVEGVTTGVEIIFGSRSLNWKIQFVEVSGTTRISFVPATGSTFGFAGVAISTHFNHHWFSI